MPRAGRRQETCPNGRPGQDHASRPRQIGDGTGRNIIWRGLVTHLPRGQPFGSASIFTFVQREGDPDNLAAPTGELQDIRTPSLIGTAGYDGAIMDTRGTPPGMPGQEKPVLLHQPVDPLGIDGIEAGGSPLALEERGDPPVSIGRTPIPRRRISEVSCASPARVCGPRFGRLPAARAIRLERATPRVSATLFTGYPPEAAIATARSVFLSVQDPEPL